MKNIMISILLMGLLGLIFSLLLSIARIRLLTKEDPMVERIEHILPGANCGSCGYPGCRAFAEAVVNGQATPDGCSVGGREVSEAIAKFMGKTIEITEECVAVILCRGNEEAARRKAEYKGIPTCLAASLVQGGDKYCSYGCLGFGDCVSACPFGAITIGNDRLPVIDRNICTGCGLCVSACPNKLIELHPVSRDFFIFCKSHDNAKISRFNCKNACLGCGICTKGAKNEEITVREGLAIINDANIINNEEAMEWVRKCPTKAIDFLEKK